MADAAAIANLGLTAGVLSDLVIIDSNLSDVQSDVIIIQSDVKQIISDLRLVDSNLSDVQSDLTIVQSDVKQIISDLRLVDSNLSDVQSDLIIVQSDVKVVISDIANVLSSRQRARLNLDFNSQYPLIENLAGYLWADTNIVANNVATSTNISQQASRYPGAVAWAYSNAGTGTTETVMGSARHLYFSAPANNDVASLIGFWPIHILPENYATYYPNDERLIFEFLGHIDVNNNNTNTVNFFIGLGSTSNIEGDLTSINYANVAATIAFRRFGFVSANTATKNVVAITDTSAAITVSTAFTPGINAIHHYKIVYDFGTNMVFSVDGATVAIISTNLAVSTASFVFYPLFWLKNISAAPVMYIFGIRCYFQNGA